jgi:tRNA nucleotidyltransferase (CCA-adding enzyme)
MHIILTHEQADFDALAAMYGASKLFLDSKPVLPRRMNRNVRSFVTLYGGEFLFTDPRDLTDSHVETVVLVDTQSLVTIKGMGRRTKISVFDHHPRRKSTPKDWDFINTETGATTSYFVERLEEGDESLTTLQATLLLLGIYEDTGSLTYASTTARDVRAAAWLLDQGASLRAASDFLNPPLTPDQRQSYDKLAAAAETLEIHGHRIILACGEVKDLNEEISTLAHKLRDLFDPDALFVLVSTSEGIRLVARSTSDDIDVAAIASQFNGGGHNRAAAAMIRSDEGLTGSELLERSRKKLVSMLPDFVRPSITVSQLMSRRPRVLSPDIPAQEAAILMQRYGYEGFPIVKNGKVVGLLTRRAVDRAISHKLNLPAESLMDAGDVYVFPGDSIQQLQLRMTDSGWGQVPVVDQKSGKVVGIVTRTDLLKTLSVPPSLSARKNLSQKLTESLGRSSLSILKAVADQATLRHNPVYIVGGFVRDLLLDLPSADFDIVVEGDAIALANTLVETHGGTITSHARFGTAKWFLEKSEFCSSTSPNEAPSVIDLISSRQEFYEHPSALPTVEHGSIKLDLHRRDFTINTLAVRLDGLHFGELHDYFGGQADLDRKLIRVLHSLSFVDDPTRMLRAVRYEQRYSFQIESRTLQLMDEARPLISRLTSERMRHELDLILEENNAAEMLARLDSLGMLKAIHVDLPWNQKVYDALRLALLQPIPPGWDVKPPASGIPLKRWMGYLIWLSSISEKEIELLQARLKLPASIYKTLVMSQRLLSDLPKLKNAKSSDWALRCDDLPMLVVYAVFSLTDEESLQDYALRWRNVHPYTNGHSLRKLGMSPGPQFQEILLTLRSAWVDGVVQSKEEETTLLNSILGK